MHFKYPELLYALLLLVIPIIIHLFQLRKFKTIPFTNVAFLQELTIQTRKSSLIKKWLTLFIRMLILASVIIAFAQPYISNLESFNTKSETVIYLDNSYSMQSPGVNGSLLNTAIQDIIENLDENEQISIITNGTNFNTTNIKAVKNDLIKLEYSASQLNYNAAVLKGKRYFSNQKSSLKNLVLISDFQQKKESLTLSSDSLVTIRVVQLKPSTKNNIVIDSVYISKTNIEYLELSVKLMNQGKPIETLPISLYNEDKLISKTAIGISNEAFATFTIPANEMFNGRLVIDDRNLQYDNVLYFNIDQRKKINVLAINNTDDTFLKKIYTSDEFNYTAINQNALNYNTIERQNLIVLNELIDIPNALITALKSFTNAGGHLLIIPSKDIVLNTYNQLFNSYNFSKFKSLNTTSKKITTINYAHPLLTNVFDKRVSNFQYPKVEGFYVHTTTRNSSILSYEDGTSFFEKKGPVSRFSAALQKDNSNFKNSPLIVPILYNVGKQSLKTGDLFYTIGEKNTIDIATTLKQDDILTLVEGKRSVIPLQKTYSNKVELITETYPKKAGIVSVKNNEILLKNLSFNFNRNESDLNYFDAKDFRNISINDSVASALSDIKSATNVSELWKWFVIFALIFLIIEMLILKFLK